MQCLIQCGRGAEVTDPTDTVVQPGVPEGTPVVPIQVREERQKQHHVYDTRGALEAAVHLLYWRDKM